MTGIKVISNIGYLTELRLPEAFVILSDDARQFDVFNHALCWVHAERHVHKLVPNTDIEKSTIEAVRGKIWDLYRSLKEYKDLGLQALREVKKVELEAEFDAIFYQVTGIKSLDEVLERQFKNKQKLLLVLRRPDIPLHTNDGERDLREYAKRRKVSGSTRSDSGRSARDAFTSLKKTSRKLGISFWDYLQDRVSKANQIPSIAALISQKAALSN